ncbi:hypothetical protein D3875_04365 [Deinococcus cavernae]|uniref:Uncharacterized protein n=1 Tax=Deinococcus cavernae TaxID=2320857 RepID=A0A418VEJ5_9DEIO|nr:hypothetical protein [Deinococcus cavernae]RJF74520.1 hypothetical protein D3875_04365 [Deinococcus cavernae]
MDATLTCLPRAATLREAAHLQARYSGRHPHVIVVGAGTEEYFVVTQTEAQRLYARGLEPLWLK